MILRILCQTAFNFVSFPNITKIISRYDNKQFKSSTSFYISFISKCIILPCRFVRLGQQLLVSIYVQTSPESLRYPYPVPKELLEDPNKGLRHSVTRSTRLLLEPTRKGKRKEWLVGNSCLLRKLLLRSPARQA